MRTVRILNEEDIPAIVELYNICLEWKSPFQSIERWNFWANPEFVKSLMNDGVTIIFGAFNNNELIAITTGEYWTKIPIWFYGGMITKIRTLKFDVEENGLADLLIAAASYGEGLGYYTCYFLVSERQDKYYTDSMLRVLNNTISKDYTVLYEDSIEGNAVSKWPIFQRIYSKRASENINGRWYIKSAVANNNRRKLHKEENGWILSQNS
jgi:hypothetical protein